MLIDKKNHPKIGLISICTQNALSLHMDFYMYTKRSKDTYKTLLVCGHFSSISIVKKQVEITLE